MYFLVAYLFYELYAFDFTLIIKKSIYPENIFSWGKNCCLFCYFHWVLFFGLKGVFSYCLSFEFVGVNFCGMSFFLIDQIKAAIFCGFPWTCSFDALIQYYIFRLACQFAGKGVQWNLRKLSLLEFLGFTVVSYLYILTCRACCRCGWRLGGGGTLGSAVLAPHHRSLCGPTVTVTSVVCFRHGKSHDHPYHSRRCHGKKRENKSSFGGDVTPGFPGWGRWVESILTCRQGTWFVDSIKTLEFVRHLGFAHPTLTLQIAGVSGLLCRFESFILLCPIKSRNVNLPPYLTTSL